MSVLESVAGDVDGLVVTLLAELLASLLALLAEVLIAVLADFALLGLGRDLARLHDHHRDPAQGLVTLGEHVPDIAARGTTVPHLALTFRA
jgi:hypothetical protein